MTHLAGLPSRRVFAHLLFARCNIAACCLQAVLVTHRIAASLWTAYSEQ